MHRKALAEIVSHVVRATPKVNTARFKGNQSASRLHSFILGQAHLRSDVHKKGPWQRNFGRWPNLRQKYSISRSRSAPRCQPASASATSLPDQGLDLRLLAASPATHSHPSRFLAADGVTDLADTKRSMWTRCISAIRLSPCSSEPFMQGNGRV